MKSILNILFYPIVFAVTLIVMIYKELAPTDGLTISDASKHARELRDELSDIKTDITSEPTETPTQQT